MYKRTLKNKHRIKNPASRVEARFKKKSTSPKETSAFLEVNEEAALTPGPSGPMALHRALMPTGQISCAK